MSFYRKNPFFYTVLFLLLAACLGGLWYLTQLSGKLTVVKASFRTKSTQYDRYLEAKPSPTRSNLEAIEANYRELYEVYDRVMRNLNLNTYNREGYFGVTPRSRADWSFELHKFKENARYAALSNGIDLPPNLDFSFNNFSDGGPPPENMDEVHQQIVIMSSLLDTLFDSGIRSFVKIQRGQKTERNRKASIPRRTANNLASEGDIFAVESGQSIAVPGTIDSYVFRLVFRGQSNSLRTFLNRIANASLPFVIRGVEADLSSEGGAKMGLESLADNPFSQKKNEFSNDGGALPIISDNTSLFAVTVEFLDLSVEIPEPDVPLEKEAGNDA